jgi:hypothetical protein
MFQLIRAEIRDPIEQQISPAVVRDEAATTTENNEFGEAKGNGMHSVRHLALSAPDLQTGWPPGCPGHSLPASTGGRTPSDWNYHTRATALSIRPRRRPAAPFRLEAAVASAGDEVARGGASRGARSRYAPS